MMMFDLLIATSYMVVMGPTIYTKKIEGWAQFLYIFYLKKIEELSKVVKETMGLLPPHA